MYLYYYLGVKVLDPVLVELGFEVGGKEPPFPAKKLPTAPRRKSTPYIRSVPVTWITRADLSFCALRLVLALYHLRGMRKSNTFRLSLPRQWKPVFSRNSKARALRELESAGLVTVQRSKGMMPVITLLDTD